MKNVDFAYSDELADTLLDDAEMMSFIKRAVETGKFATGVPTDYCS